MLLLYTVPIFSTGFGLLSTHANRQGVNISITACLKLYVFVRLRIYLPRIKLAASNFARPELPCCNMVLLGSYDSHAYQVCTACGRGSACVDIRQSPKMDVLVVL